MKLMIETSRIKVNETVTRPAGRLEWVEAAIDAGLTFERPKMVATGSTVIDGKNYTIVDFAERRKGNV